jgi:hypothetical protein
MDNWSGALLGIGVGMPFTYTSGAADVTVVADPSLHNTGYPAATDNHRVIRLNPDFFGHGLEAWIHILTHEFGHVLGYSDVWTQGCDSGQTVMYGGVDVNNGPIMVNVGEADTCALDEDYPPPQEPPPSEPIPHVPLEQGLGDPLVLDLNGDGIHTTSLSHPVWFDMLGNGQLIEMAWTNPVTEEAFLWLDVVPNNRVDNGRELFGVGTVLPSGALAGDGFAALSIYDLERYGGDGDGFIDRDDDVWHRLRLWVDRDHDARSSADEVRPIHESQILAIALPRHSNRSRFPDVHGNVHGIASTYSIRNGNHLVIRQIHNLVFAVQEP